jgi:hypothetical protein
VHERWIDELFAGLTRAEMSQLLDLLAKLKSSVQRERADAQEDGS